MAGLTDQGFVPKTYEELLTEMRARATTLFQDLLTEPGDIVDTTDSTILGRLINLDIAGDIDLWQVAQMVYSSFDPNSATGIALDNLVAYAGIVREEQTFTTSPVLVEGDVNTLITSGATVSSSTTAEQYTVNSPITLITSSASGVTVSVLNVANSTAYTISYTSNTTTNTITYTSDGSATVDEILNGLQGVIQSSHPSLLSSVVGSTLVIDRTDVFQAVSWITSSNLGITKVRVVGEVVAVNSGPIDQPVNSIDTILTPQIGWDSVANPVSATSGRNRETDEELRERFRTSKFNRAGNSIDAIFSAITNVDGVTEVTIYENDTSVVDSNGVPAHSFLPIVVGGLSTDIANAIWDNKPIGILSYGNTTVVINDKQGFPHNVSFSRPTPITVYISIDITTDANFPANGDDAIKTALASYYEANQGTGDDIVYSRMYTPINTVPGHQVNSLFIGTTPSPVGTSNIVIPFDSIAVLNTLNVNITHT